MRKSYDTKDRHLPKGEIARRHISVLQINTYKTPQPHFFAVGTPYGCLEANYCPTQPSQPIWWASAMRSMWQISTCWRRSVVSLVPTETILIHWVLLSNVLHKALDIIGSLKLIGSKRSQKNQSVHTILQTTQWVVPQSSSFSTLMHVCWLCP